jgi:hypothetical protein
MWANPLAPEAAPEKNRGTRRKQVIPAQNVVASVNYCDRCHKQRCICASVFGLVDADPELKKKKEKFNAFAIGLSLENKRDKVRLAPPECIAEPKAFRWSQLTSRERRHMVLLLDHVADCGARLRAMTGDCGEPGCSQMRIVVDHNMTCPLWTTGRGHPFDQICEVYEAKEPRKMRPKHLNKVGEKTEEEMWDCLHQERKRYQLPIEGVWCWQCREAARLQRMHRKECRKHRTKKKCQIPGCGGGALPGKPMKGGPLGNGNEPNYVKRMKSISCSQSLFLLAAGCLGIYTKGELAEQRLRMKADREAAGTRRVANFRQKRINTRPSSHADE